MAVIRTPDGFSNASEDVIQIEEPRSEWPRLFLEEATRISAKLPDDITHRIEHFGSTAVPRLAAKPVIDIMLIVDEVDRWSVLRGPIESLEYVFWSENPREDRLFFAKGMPPYGKKRTHHLHVRVTADSQRELAFRDALRASTATAAEYAMLKRKLADRFTRDREAYTEAKSDFVERVLAEHRNEA